MSYVELFAAHDGVVFIESVVTKSPFFVLVNYGQNSGFLVVDELHDVGLGSTGGTVELHALVVGVAVGFSEVSVLAVLDFGLYAFTNDSVYPEGIVDAVSGFLIRNEGGVAVKFHAGHVRGVVRPTVGADGSGFAAVGN